MTDLFETPPADEPKKKRAARVKDAPVQETAAAPVGQEVLPPEPEAPQTGTAVMVLDNPHITAIQVFGDQKSADSIIEVLTKQAKAEAAKLDISTKKGREAIASLAFKIAKSKVALDNLGKEMNESARAQINRVDAERRRIKEAVEALQHEIRAPLTAWESADKLRIEAHEEALLILENAAVFSSTEPTVDEIDARVKEIIPLMQRKWEEFETRAIAATNVARRDLVDLRARTVQREADRVELARLREQEEQRRIEREAKELLEREEKIAREAAEAEREKAEQIAKEKAEKAAAELAAAQAEKQRIEQERQAAVQRAEEAESARAEEQRVAHIRSLIDHIVNCGNGVIDGAVQAYGILFHELEERIVIDDTFAEFKDEAAAARAAAIQKLRNGQQRQAEATRLAEEQAEAQKLAADRAAEQARLSGIETERQRAADEQAAADAERTKREQNKAHAAKINRAVMEDLAKVVGTDGHPCVTVSTARAIVEAIARGHVVHCKIEY